MTKGQNKFKENTFLVCFYGYVGKGTMEETGSIK